jgi:outer membrane protein OmpA-like peptidoglycan-associated protein
MKILILTPTWLNRAICVAVISMTSASASFADDPNATDGFLDPQHLSEHQQLEKALRELESARDKIVKEREETAQFARHVLEEIRAAKEAKLAPIVEEKERRIAELERQNLTGERRIGEMEKERAGLIGRMEEIAAKLKQMETVSPELEELKGTAERERVEMGQKFREATEAFNRKHKATDEQIHELKMALETALKKSEGMNKANAERERLLEELNGLRNTEKALDAELQKMNEATAPVQKENAKLKQDLEAMRNEVAGMKVKGGETIKQLNEGLTKAKDDHQVTTRELDLCKKVIDESQKKIDALAKENAVLNASLKVAMSGEEGSKKAIVDLQQKVVANMNEFTRLTAECKEAKEKSQTLSEDVKQKGAEIEALRSEMAKAAEVSKHWDEDKADMVATKAELEGKLSEALLKSVKVEELSSRVRGELVKEKIAVQKLERQLAMMQLPDIAPIYFGLSDNESAKEQERVLGEVKAILGKFPELKFHVVGHTCNQGSDESNLALSEARAKTLADYLLANGLAANRVDFEGKGETAPTNDNSTEDLRKKNRRVEVWFSN